jgi:hypothetical protein
MFIGASPGADFNPRFSRALAATTLRDHTPIPDFSTAVRERAL